MFVGQEMMTSERADEWYCDNDCTSSLVDDLVERACFEAGSPRRGTYRTQGRPMDMSYEQTSATFMPDRLASSSWTHVIVVDRSTGRTLGVAVDEEGTVTDIGDGLIMEWNEANPHQQVEIGDRLVGVNGVYHDLPLLFELCGMAQVLVLELHCARISGPVPPAGKEEACSACNGRGKDAIGLTCLACRGRVKANVAQDTTDAVPADFRSMPPAAWAAIHARFPRLEESVPSDMEQSHAEEQETVSAPGDFRSIQTCAWAGIHARFQPLPVGGVDMNNKSCVIGSVAEETRRFHARQVRAMVYAAVAKVVAAKAMHFITIDRSSGARLGITVDTEDGVSLRLDRISEGLIMEWNEANPGRILRAGDRIVAVNGVRADVPSIVEQCSSNGVLELEIQPAQHCMSEEAASVELDAETAGLTFGPHVVVLDRTHGAKLGLDVEFSDGKSLRIEAIADGGLVDAWNVANPKQLVSVGDHIVQVNDASHDAIEIAKECQKDTLLVMLVAPLGVMLTSPEDEIKFASIEKVPMEEGTADEAAGVSSQAAEKASAKDKVDSALGMVPDKSQMGFGLAKAQTMSAMMTAQVSQTAQKSFDFAKFMLRTSWRHGRPGGS